MDFDRFLDLLPALAREGVDDVLVGGVALGLHGLVRATEDAALFVRPEAGNVERLKRALGTVWDDPDIADISAADLAGDDPTVRYGPPGEAFVVDLLGRLGWAFAFEDPDLQTITVEGVPVWRFRDLDEARRTLWLAPDDPALGARLRRLRAFWAPLAPPLAQPRGVRRFRTIEAANADREQWAAERVRALRVRRTRAPSPGKE